MPHTRPTDRRAPDTSSSTTDGLKALVRLLARQAARAALAPSSDESHREHVDEPDDERDRLTEALGDG